MALPHLPFVVLDTETTGFIPKVNRVIEFASMRFNDGSLTDTYDTLISIPTAVPDVVQVLTRIRNDDLKDKPTMDEVRATIEERIGTDTIIVGQNVGFDIRMLKGEGIDLTDRLWIDTSMLASLVFPELASYSLGYVSQVLELDHEPVHRALGDVRATTALLEACWNRLSELTPELRAPLDAIMARAPEGYRGLFAALPASDAPQNPQWLTAWSKKTPIDAEPVDAANLSWVAHSGGGIQLVEAPLDPGFLQSVVDAASREHETAHWLAVKNSNAVMEYLKLPANTRLIQPASALLDTDAVAAFAQQEAYTADEATLALKLAWYEPRTETELPIHGDERMVWKGKLAATPESEIYRKQFESLPSVVLLNHWQLLGIAADAAHPAYAGLAQNSHVIIDDASMLEDTTTRAYGWHCNASHLRAAAEGDEILSRFVDLLQIWLERTRRQQDIYYLTAADLSSPETTGLREQIAQMTGDKTTPAKTAELLNELDQCLNPAAIADRIAFIETRQDGAQMLESVPARVADLLKQRLYDRVPTTLLIPPGSAGELPQIVPPKADTTLIRIEDVRSGSCALGIRTELKSMDMAANPPAGKTVILLSSRARIEEAYVKLAESVEQKGVTLICQSLSGGMGRMQAEFLAAESPAVWILTPWSFETAELPLHTVDQMVIDMMPFDHPAHAVLSKRSEQYRSAFSEYSLPRLKQRMYRLLRTFCRFRTDKGHVIILDDRLEKKDYGRTIAVYLDALTQPMPDEAADITPKKLDTDPPAEAAPEVVQTSLF